MRWTLLLLVPLLVAAGVLTADEKTEPRAGAYQPPPLRTIAERVAAIRGLEFKRLPAVRRVSAADQQRRVRRALRDADPKDLRSARTAADLLKRLALMELDETIQARVQIETGNTVGFYRFKKRDLTLVTGQGGSPAFRERVLAHELTHALDAQYHDIRDFDGESDRASAYRAVVEGSAQWTELQYAREHLGHDAPTRAQLLARPPASTVKGTADTFTNLNRLLYTDGARYAAALGDDADRAFRRPPLSVAEILHPGRPRRRPPRLGPAPALAGHVRLDTGTFGEFETQQLLLRTRLLTDDLTARETGRLAEPWRAGRYTQLRRGGRDRAGCRRLCLGRDVVVLDWRFAGAAAARAYARGLEPYMTAVQSLKPRARGGFFGTHGGGTVTRDGRDLRLVLAPSLSDARSVGKG